MGVIQQQALLKSLKGLYVEGTYSDLTITNGDKQYRVHKAIVCPRSKFFANACNGEYKESQTGVVDLPEDDPQAVQLMVHYFYHLDYPHVSLYGEPKTEPGPEPELKPEPRPRVVKSRANFMPEPEEPEPDPWGFGIKRENKKRGKAEEIPTNIGIPNLIIHTMVYALADKYFVKGLKELALEKFEKETERYWDTEEFLQAVKMVYTSTGDGDRELRDAVLRTLHQRNSLLGYKTTKQVLKQTEDLAYDLLMFVWDRKNSF